MHENPWAASHCPRRWYGSLQHSPNTGNWEEAADPSPLFLPRTSTFGALRLEIRHLLSSDISTDAAPCGSYIGASAVTVLYVTMQVLHAGVMVSLHLRVWLSPSMTQSKLLVRQTDCRHLQSRGLSTASQYQVEQPSLYDSFVSLEIERNYYKFTGICR